MGTVVLSRVQSGRGVKLTAYLQLEARLGRSGAVQLFLPGAFMEWPGTNLSFIFIFLWFYLHLRWYNCQTQTHDSTVPTTNVFHKTACRLGPNLLFRTVKFLTNCRIHLLDAEGKLVTKHVGTPASKIFLAWRCGTM
jgi:hypothetical protein